MQIKYTLPGVVTSWINEIDLFFYFIMWEWGQILAQVKLYLQQALQLARDEIIAF